MTLTTEYDSNTDETTVYWQDDKFGSFEGRSAKTRNGINLKVAEVVKDNISDPMVVDLVIGLGE